MATIIVDKDMEETPYQSRIRLSKHQSRSINVTGIQPYQMTARRMNESTNRILPLAARTNGRTTYGTQTVASTRVKAKANKNNA